MLAFSAIEKSRPAEAISFMKNNSILIVAPSAYLLSGLATWLDYLLPGLKSAGYDVTLGLVNGPRHHRSEKYLAEHPFDKSIAIACNCSTPYGRRLSAIRAMRETKPSLVLTVNIPDALLAAMHLRNKGSDIRAIMTCHGIQGDLFVDMKSWCHDVDAVVCTNKLACQIAVSHAGVSEDRVFHAPYGTSIADLKLHPRDRNCYVIGYTGRLEQPQKRIHDLLAISKELSTKGFVHRFLVAGSGPEENALRSEIRQQGLEKSFELMGFVSPESLNERFFSQVDAVVVTSSWETGPLVVWESMARRIPVVSSKYIGSRAEGILKSRENALLFEIGSTEECSRAILELAGNDSLRESIVQGAFQTLQNRLTCEKSVENWISILERVKARSPKQTSLFANPLPAGKFEKFFGNAIGSRVRSIIGRLPPDSGPGGEWPHTVAKECMDEKEFLDMAQKLEQSS